MSFTKRLTYWVDRPEGNRFADCRVHYRFSEGKVGSAQLLIEGRDRFVEVLLRDTGEAEFATGRLGHHGAGGYVELDDESQVDHLLERVEREIDSWRAAPDEVSDASGPGVIDRGTDRARHR